MNAQITPHSRFTATIAILLTVALTAIGCSGNAPHNLADFTTQIYTPTYASGFDIRSADDGPSTLITVRNPWQGAADQTQHLLLLRGDEEHPTNFSGQVIKAPLRRVVCMSSSHVALFDAVGEARRIVGVSGIDFITNPYIVSHRLCGEVRDVGYDTNIDFELLASMRPDAVLLYGVTGENSTITGKLRELGIPYIYVGDYMEESPLGKAEWIIFAAELCDLRQKGEETFRAIASRYEALREQIAADSTSRRPTVMLNTPYRDTWFMPSTKSYMIRLVEDAGGRYIYTQNSSNSSVAVDLEEAYLLARSAEVWINVGGCSTLAALKSENPKFAEIPSVKNCRVWNNNRRATPKGGSDFWESGVVRPDVVLRDLHTLLTERADTTHYYHRLR